MSCRICTGRVQLCRLYKPDAKVLIRVWGVVEVMGMPKKRPGLPAQAAASFMIRASVRQTCVCIGVPAIFFIPPIPNRGIGMTPSQVGSCMTVMACCL